jgi:hypothetical protein
VWPGYDKISGAFAACVIERVTGEGEAKGVPKNIAAIVDEYRFTIWSK